MRIEELEKILTKNLHTVIEKVDNQEDKTKSLKENIKFKEQNINFYKT